MPQDVTEYGVGAFGSPECGEAILSWVRENYGWGQAFERLKEGAVEVLRFNTG